MASTFRNLCSKLAIILLGLFLVVAASLVAITSIAVTRYQMELVQSLHLSLAENLIATKVVSGSDFDHNLLEQAFDQLMTVNPSIEVYLLRNDGIILAYSAAPGKVKRTAVSLDPIKRFLAPNVRLPILGDDPRDPNGHKIFSVASVPNDGYLYVILGGEQYDSAGDMLKRSYIMRLAVWFALGCLAFAAVTGLLAIAFITNPLRVLVGKVEAFRHSQLVTDGSLDRTRPRKWPDEIDVLANAFDQLTDRVVAQVRELERTDASRRDFISAVSHDLKSPLATLRASLDRLLSKDAALSSDQRHEHLQNIARHSERLDRLIGQLFELARLESPDIRLNAESFLIAELAQDVLQKFRLRAEEQGVHMALSVRMEMAFVVADIELIERVLSNLVENALQHTTSNDRIEITVDAADGEVTVTVSDTGAGIEADALPHIFNRWYRGSPGMPNKHGGLGLSIVKHIMELHGSDIQVESVPGKGTTFSFGLPLARPDEPRSDAPFEAPT